MPGSGSIRSRLPLLKHRFKQVLDSGATLLNESAPLAPDTNEDIAWTRLYERFKALQSKLIKGIAAYQALDTEWLRIISTLSGDEETDELTLYEQNGGGDEGFQTLLMEGEDLLSDLEARVSAIQENQAKLQSIQAPTMVPSNLRASAPSFPPTNSGVPRGSGTPSNVGNGNGDRSRHPSHQSDDLNGSFHEEDPDANLNLMAPGTPGFRPRNSIPPPKLVLPKFDGDPLKWRSFWSFFEATIHKRVDLTDIEKMSYLLAQLEGKAKDIVEDIVLSNENYPIVVSLLLKRFSRSDIQLLSKVAHEFHQLPRSGDRLDDKRCTLDKCTKMFRRLEAAGNNLEENAMFSQIFLQKFPYPMVRDLLKNSEANPTSPISVLLDEVNKYLEKAELHSEFMSTYSNRSSDGTQSDKGSGSKFNPRFQKGSLFKSGSNSGHNSAMSAVAKGQKSGGYSGSGRTAYSGNQSQQSATMFPCYFCGGNHFNSNCPKYTTIKSRESRLKEVNRCLRCGRKHTEEERKRPCERKIICYKCKVPDKHTTYMCPGIYSGKGSSGSNTSANRTYAAVATAHSADQPNEDADDVANLSLSSNRRTLFQTAIVTIEHPVTKTKKVVRLCLDTMSNRSYIRTRVAKEMGLHPHITGTLKVSTFGRSKKISIPTNTVQFHVLLRNGGFLPIEANTTTTLNGARLLPKSWPNPEFRLLQAYNKRGQLADNPFDSKLPMDVVIGADYAWCFITEAPRRTKTVIQLVPTTLGLMLAGRLFNSDEAPDNAIMMYANAKLVPREAPDLMVVGTLPSKDPPDVQNFWDLETIGIRDDPVQQDDQVAQRIFDSTVQFDKGRYQVTWPWIPEKKVLLPSNFATARKRFQSLEKRVTMDPNILKAYQDTIDLQLERGIIEKVPEEELRVDHTVHYLPHHPVVKLSSNTTKVRIVYDASSRLRRSDVSLNECMIRGPVILPDLCQLLMRFRSFSIVILSDVEKAFLQISLQNQERDVTRFLWFKDSTNPSASQYEIFRFCRVPFGVISSPFLLGATIQLHLSAQGTEFAEALKNDIYMDNVISGVESEEDCLSYYEQTKELFRTAGMNLQEYCANAPTFMASIPECDRIRNPNTKVLGICWDSQGTDSLRIQRSSKWCLDVPTTKRSVLQSIASIFDPLGLFQPAILQAKLFLQELWVQGYGWDDVLPDDLRETWDLIQKDISPLFDYSFPRSIGPLNVSSSIVVFSDASIMSYGAAVYLRTLHSDGTYVVHLLFAKIRLTPSNQRQKKRQSLRVITLPRLELLGVTIAARMGQFCRSALRLSTEIALFTDSECVLHWLRTDSKLERFVQRRIDTLRDSKDVTFSYVPTKSNPADYLTRGLTGAELCQDNSWWHGPSWLAMDSDHWPISNIGTISSEALREVTPKQVLIAQMLAAPDAIVISDALLGIELTNHSSLPKLLRITAICISFLRKRVWNRLSGTMKDRLLPSCSNTIGSDSFEDHLSASAYIQAESLWAKSVQQSAYCDLIVAIHTKRRHPLMRQLGVQLDSNGYLRTHSRYANADLQEFAKYPVLLPAHHRFTRLVVLDCHSRLYHSGLAHTLSQLRQKFWIPKGRAYVRSVLHQCLVCRRYKSAQPVVLPSMPPWPRERVQRSIPFQHTGLDYFGPIKIRSSTGEISKMWVCLFSYLTTRAIHLEIVTDCSTAQFLQALVRFVSRRGCPSIIICDNAGQFRLTKILFEEAWHRLPTDPNILSYSATNNVCWKFITELAPWQGGHYERLVGVVKSVLKTIIGRRLLSWYDLVTLLTETEAIVNTRPITYVTDDPASQYRVLTPNDFLSGAKLNLPDNFHEFSVKNFGEAGKFIAKIWKQRHRYLQKLWEFWYDEYLLALRERAPLEHSNRPGSTQRSPREGEVVIVKDDDMPRGSWKLAKIIKCIPSRDGKIRAATVKLSSGIELNRAVNFLVPLEIEGTIDNIEIQNSSRDGHHGTEQHENENNVTPGTSGDNRDNQNLPSQIQDSNLLGTQDETSDTFEDDDLFFGFSKNDIARTMNLLQQFPSI